MREDCEHAQDRQIRNKVEAPMVEPTVLPVVRIDRPDPRDAHIVRLREALNEARPFVVSDIAVMENEITSGRRTLGDVVIDEVRKLLKRIDSALKE